MKGKRRKYRPHQRVLDDYAGEVDHPALIAEMRLGKTMVMIRRIQQYSPQDGKRVRALIVVPNSGSEGIFEELLLEGVSEEEIGLLNEGSKEKRQKVLQAGLPWNIANPEAHRAIPEMRDVSWDAVVLDEGVFVSNPRTQVTDYFLKNFRKVPHRWLLTGSLGTGGPDDGLRSFCPMAFLHDSAFGQRSYWQFRSTHYNPVGDYGWVPRPGTQTFVREYLSKYACVMRRKDVLLKEPVKVIAKRRVTLPPELRRSYRIAEDEFVLEYNGQLLSKTKHAPVNFHVLRKLCSGFLDNNKLVWHGKIQELLSLLNGELLGEPVVVWFQYNHEIREVFKILKQEGFKVEYLIGGVPKANRRAIYRRFNSGETQVLLVQQMLAKRGANLSGADTAIYFSLPAGAEAWSQSQDRILTLEKKNLLLVILLAEDTVEEDILESLRDQHAARNWNLGRVYSLTQKRREARAQKTKRRKRE